MRSSEDSRERAVAISVDPAIDLGHVIGTEDGRAPGWALDAALLARCHHSELGQVEDLVVVGVPAFEHLPGGLQARVLADLKSVVGRSFKGERARSEHHADHC